MDTLYSLKRDLEKVIGHIHNVCLKHRTHDKHSAWIAVYFSHPSFNQVEGLARKVDALREVDATLAAALDPFLQQAQALAVQIAQAKVAEAAAKAAKKQAQADRAALQEIKAKNPYHGLNELVAKVLREVAEPYRLEMVADVLADEQASYVKLVADTIRVGSANPSVIYPYPGSKGATMATYARHQANVDFARRYTAPVSNDYKAAWAMRPNPEAIAQAHAEKAGEAAVNAFIQKVGAKLSGLVECKGNLKETAITGSLRSHWMTFTFADGSSFQVQSQIVWKTSVNGVHFYQYPTCFRNVIQAGGVKMVLPSEEKMKKEFV